MSEYMQNQREVFVAQTLGRIEGKLDELTVRNKEVMDKLDDHSRRLEVLEKRVMWTVGWIAGAVIFGAGSEWIIARFL